jgi:hypothetical protein
MKSGPCDPLFFDCPGTDPGGLMKRHLPREKFTYS